MKHTLRSIGALLAVLAGAALLATSAGAASAGNPWHGVPGDGVSAGHPWHGYHDSALAGHPWSD